MAGTSNTKAPSVVSALRAIVSAADADAGGDKAYSEIPSDLICDARLALATFDREFNEAGRVRSRP